jgi:[acyl-carrier-protein] S-malonyltransferase
MENKQLAFVFPGQGSQAIGMLSALAQDFDIVAGTFTQASERLGYDLWEVTQNGPEADLNRTAVTQPALLTAGVAVWRIWQSRNGSVPVLLAGHSLGEYTALVCAGVLQFDQAVSLVEDRGKTMQSAVPEGSGLMAAILGLDDAAVETVCRAAARGQVVTTANYNSPGQVVIAGDRDAVQRAIDLAREQGAKRAIPLSVSVPSHCALMREAATVFAARIEAVDFSDATIPVIQNVDATARTDSADIKAALVRQLHEPVRWVDSVNNMKAAGISTIIESGPGKVLTGLIKRIDRGMNTLAINDTSSLESALQEAENEH